MGLCRREHGGDAVSEYAGIRRREVLDPAEAQKVLDSGENRSYERPWELWKRQAQGK
jgi:hypothetical protein